MRDLVARAERAVAYVWKRDALFLAAVTAMNLFFARRTFSPGIWADNDSVSHYAYIRYFVEEFHPKTDAILGWCPKYNMGLPYLLFNTPPLLYLTAGFTALASGMTPLLALKLWMTAAFLAIPLLAYALARTFEDSSNDLAKCVAVATSLFSSELFGLEFFFKNGMLNPAFALPFLFATLVAYRHAITKPFPRSLASIGWTGVFFALTICTHTLSAYMVSVALVGFAFGAPIRAWGANLLGLGASLAIGATLAAWWLVPSLPFGATHDVAYTWIREPGWTIGHLFDGSLLSSYPVGFFPEFAAFSNVAIIANACIVYGAVEAWKRRSYAFLGCAIAMLLALWISVGPRYSWGISIAPMYDRLLWYRFVTLVAAMAFVMAGYGAWRLTQRSARGWPVTMLLVAAGCTWAFYVMCNRAVKVKTAASQPDFASSVDRIATWLREKGDKRGRLYSEFLGWNVPSAISVNYTREILPVDTGFEEVGGWIYENNPASQVLQRKGPYWYDAIPMVDLAPRYDVKYVVAGTPNFVRALSEDPRWTKVLETPPLVLFEAKRAPARVEATGWDTRIEDERYERGGGYRYSIALARHLGERSQSELLVKTNGSPGWRATTGGRSLATRATDDGLLAIDLPADLPDEARIDLLWDVSDRRRLGDRVSLAGLVAFLALALASRASFAWARRFPARILSVAGVGGAALAIVLLAVLARRRDLSHIGFGIADGLEPAVDPATVHVGRFDDDVDTRPNRVDPQAWGPRETCRDVTCRRLVADASSVVASVTLATAGPNSLVMGGVFDDAAEHPITLVLVEPDGRGEGCALSARLGEPVAVPPSCTGDRGAPGGPGIVRGVRIAAAPALRVSSIEARNGIVWLEGESFRNVLDDGGGDAFYALGAPEYKPSNGVVMVANAGWGAPVRLAREIDLAPGEYEAWGLGRMVPERFLLERADVLFEVNGREIGQLGSRADPPLVFWDQLVRFAWTKIGRFQAERSNALGVSIQWREGARGASADLDAIALVPR